MKLTITILFIFLAAISCKKDIYSGITFNAPVFPDSVVVKTEVVNDTLYTKTAWGLASYRNYLILLANMDDCLFQVYDKTTGERVRSFGQLGRGPQEILPVSSFYINDEKGILTSFNQSTKDVLVFHLDSIFSGKEHVMDKLNLSQYPGMTFLEALPARNHFLLYGVKCKVYPGGARYTLFAEDGKYISSYDDYPLSSSPSDSIDKPLDWMNLSTTRALSPDGTKLAEATRVGGILETFEVADKIAPMALKGYYKPHFYQDKNEQIFTPKTQFGFYYLSASNHYLYALSFNGSHSDLYPSSEMQVFDWQGNPVKKYKTDKLLLNVCADEKVGKIYALAQTPLKEFILISFNL